MTITRLEARDEYMGGARRTETWIRLVHVTNLHVDLRLRHVNYNKMAPFNRWGGEIPNMLLILIYNYSNSQNQNIQLRIT